MKDKLVAELAEALEMEVSQIKSADTFRDYDNYDSLTELSVLAMLDSEFGVEIEMKEFGKYLTVSDLVHLITDRSQK